MESLPSLFRDWAKRRPSLEQIHRDKRFPGHEYAYNDPNCLAIILHDWAGDVWLDGRHQALARRTVSLVPVGVRRVFRPREAGWHRVVNFAALHAAEPAFLALGPDFDRLCRIYDECLSCFGSERSRAELKAWELLWELADVTDLGGGAGASSNLVRRALGAISLRLSQEITVGGLAKELGVSHAHLSRAFRRELGIPVVAHLRNRRMDLARHLLTRTTQPVREVAAVCGIPDAQHFNKTVRRSFGCSPSALRRRAFPVEVGAETVT